MKNRYTRNFKMMAQEEFTLIQDKTVCVIGCGGLGGYVIEMLGRIGVGKVICVDGDNFDETNLNRQLLCDENSIGVNKAKKAAERMKIVNSEVKVVFFSEMLSEQNINTILKDVDVVVDALDSIRVRMVLQSACEKLEIPMVHGAIAGWFGQVTTILPGDRTLDFLYKRKNQDKGIENELGNPSFTPGNIASVQVGEVVKIIIGRGEILSRKILFIDMLNNDYEIVEI